MAIKIQDMVLSDPGGGGVNELVKPDAVADNQSAPPDSSTLALKNCHTNSIKDIVKRKGYTKYSGRLGTLNEVTGLFQYRKFDGSEFEVACASDGTTETIYNISSPASPVDITNAAVITSDSKFSFCVHNDLLIMTTEARDTPLKWDGGAGTATLGGSPTAGKYCIEFENFTFIANTSANPERTYWSNITDPETWTATDFVRSIGAVTGLGRAGNNLFIFTLNGIKVARFTGDSVAPFSFDDLETNVGCASHHSIVNVEGRIYWVGNDGHMYVMNGLTPKRITEVIPITIARINDTVLGNVIGVDHRELRQIWFSYGLDASSTNNFIIAFDYINQELFFYDGIEANVMANFTTSSGAIQTYFGDRNGYVYKTNDGTDDYPSDTKTKISMVRYTKRFHLDSPSRLKRFRKISAILNSSGSGITQFTTIGDADSASGESITLSHNTGGVALGSFILGTSALGGQATKFDSKDICTTTRTLQLKIENDQTGVTIKVSDIMLPFQLLRRLR